MHASHCVCVYVSQALGVIASFRLNSNKLIGKILSFGSSADGINLNWSPVQVWRRVCVCPCVCVFVCRQSVCGPGSPVRESLCVCARG